MIKKITLAAMTLALAGGLAGCASIPTEYTSPCTCLYEPINNSPIDATDEGVTVT